MVTNSRVSNEYKSFCYDIRESNPTQVLPLLGCASIPQMAYMPHKCLPTTKSPSYFGHWVCALNGLSTTNACPQVHNKATLILRPSSIDLF